MFCGPIYGPGWFTNVVREVWLVFPVAIRRPIRGPSWSAKVGPRSGPWFISNGVSRIDLRTSSIRKPQSVNHIVLGQCIFVDQFAPSFYSQSDVTKYIICWNWAIPLEQLVRMSHRLCRASRMCFGTKNIVPTVYLTIARMFFQTSISHNPRRVTEPIIYAFGVARKDLPNGIMFTAIPLGIHDQTGSRSLLAKLAREMSGFMFFLQLQ